MEMEGLAERVGEKAEELIDEVVNSFVEVLKVRAVNPSMGGEGEYRRAGLVEGLLRRYGLGEVERFDAPDERVREGVRPNIVSVIKGEDKGRTLWLVAHLDTVPEGDIKLWKTDPYTPVIKEGKIIARGAEDNGQAIASMILMARILRELNLKPKTNLGLVFVSDEEAGSKYGIKHLIDKGVFKPMDEVIVLDYGSPDGSVIEVAEKHILWLKITVYGVQTHASTPHKGLNAHRIGMRFALAVDQILHEKFRGHDPLFDPPESTFEPTKKEQNVGNINTIPGTDVIHFDCRVLPRYNLSDIMDIIDRERRAFELIYGVKIVIEEVMKGEAPPPTSPDSGVVRKLKEALKLTRGVEAKTIGIGGGTCAAYFRRAGIPSAVWATLDKTAHQANEYCRIENIRKDAETLALASMLP